MTGHVPIETVLAIQHIHVAVMGTCAFVETYRDVELTMYLEQWIPMIGMPKCPSIAFGRTKKPTAPL